VTPLPPHWYEVVLGCFAVLAGCIAAAAAVSAGRRLGNWLFHVVAAGAGTFVVGIVGQRSFPATATAVPGPWEAGVRFPWIGVAVTPVALAGLLLGSLGVSLLLLFDPVPPGSVTGAAPGQGELEDEDST